MEKFKESMKEDDEVMNQEHAYGSGQIINLEDIMPINHD